MPCIYHFGNKPCVKKPTDLLLLHEIWNKKINLERTYNKNAIQKKEQTYKNSDFFSLQTGYIFSVKHYYLEIVLI